MSVILAVHHFYDHLLHHNPNDPCRVYARCYVTLTLLSLCFRAALYPKGTRCLDHKVQKLQLEHTFQPFCLPPFDPAIVHPTTLVHLASQGWLPEPTLQQVLSQMTF